MRRSRRFIVLVALFTAILLLGIAPTAMAQGSQPKDNSPSVIKENEQLLKAVLAEVRQLRLAIQQTNVNTLRVQLGVERVRLQRECVDRISRELGEVRMNLTEATSNRPRMLERLKEMETRFSVESDPTLHANLEAEYKDFKFNVEQQKTTMEQQRERESQLLKSFQEEQGKLDELNSQLDAFEREMERQLASNKP